MKFYADWAERTIARIRSGHYPELYAIAVKMTEVELKLVSWLPIALSKYSFDFDVKELTLAKIHLGDGLFDTAIDIKVLKATPQILCLAVLTYATVSADANFNLFLSSAGEHDDIALGKIKKNASGQWPITLTITFVNDEKDDCKIMGLTPEFVDSLPTIDFGEIEPKLLR